MSGIRERTLEAQGRATPDLQAIRLRVNGAEVIVDPMTLTGRERQQVRAALAKVKAELGVEADENDGMIAAIWVVLRRTDPSLTFEEVLDSVTMRDLMSAERVASDEDDSPEA